MSHISHKADYLMIWLATMTVVLFAIALPTYWQFVDDRNPITYSNMPFPVDKKVYNPGDTLWITVSFCRNSLAPSTDYEQFIDGIGFGIPPVQRGGSSEEGCVTNRTFPRAIPKTLPPSTYTLTGKRIFKVNPIATRVVTWETEPFIVVP